jgi:integral membrane protein
VTGAVSRYRVMAWIVGVLLIVLCLVGLPLHYGYLLAPDLVPKGGTGWQLGADISRYLGVAHGWLYLIFLVTAFDLARKCRWDWPFTLLTLGCGTVPILSFWAERRASARALMARS